MNPFIEEKGKFGCCNCSQGIVGDKLVWCSCCLRIYCVQCFSALQIYVALFETRIEKALGQDREKLCMKDYFSAVEHVILAESLARMPVPDRTEGH